MCILGLLHSNSVEEIKIDGQFNIPKSYYENSNVLELKDVKAHGTIKRIDSDNDNIKLECSGKMKITDSISLEEVWYPFSFKIDDNLKEIYTKGGETLDIFELLWENIVLEVPLSYSEVKDLSKYKGNGWSLKEESDDENRENNPFGEILKDFGKE